MHCLRNVCILNSKMTFHFFFISKNMKCLHMRIMNRRFSYPSFIISIAFIHVIFATLKSKINSLTYIYFFVFNFMLKFPYWRKICKWIFILIIIFLLDVTVCRISKCECYEFKGIIIEYSYTVT